MNLRTEVLAWEKGIAALAMLLCFSTAAFGASKNPPVVSVHEVLRDEDGDFIPDMLGKIVAVKGVLTSKPDHNDKISMAHFQDDTGGLVLVSPDIHQFDQVTEGDTILVRGRVSQNRGMEELVVQRIEMVSSGEVPSPREVHSTNLLGERFSGQLVRVTGQVVPSGLGGQESFVLRDERGAVPVFIPPHFLKWKSGELSYKLWKGDKVTITGIAGQEKVESPYNAGYGLIPRTPEDFVFPPPPPPPPLPPSRLPLYVALGIAGLMGILALYLWRRRRAAERRMREVSRLLREIERSENEAKKQAAFAQLNPNPVLEFFADGTLTYFNPAARTWSATLNKDSVEELLPADARAIVKECISTERPRLKCETLVSGRTLAWSFFPIHELTSVHAYGYDITDQISLELQLRQAQKLECVGQLAAGIAHDFNNLLSVIQGYAALTLMRSDLPPKLAEPLNEIGAAAERAANLTRQLLTFSRRQTIELRHLNLNDVVTNLARMLHRLLGEDVRLQLQCTCADAWVHADPGMIEQVIVNLAVNARDAMPEGGELTVSLARKQITAADTKQRFEARPGDFVCLTVSDNGSGMDDVTLKRIFEPFFTTKEPGKGTGLGLATVHGIVKQHKGWIEVTSTVNKGTRFNLYFPCHSEPIVERSEKVIRLPIAGGTETVLVVEDDPALRKFARSVLEEYGYGVVDAGSSREALAAWKEHHENIRLVFTDIVLPDGVSGWKLAEQLRAQRPDLKVIFTTGFELKAIDRRFAQVPDAALLRKPYIVESLVAAVREALDNVPTVATLNTSQTS